MVKRAVVKGPGGYDQVKVEDGPAVPISSPSQVIVDVKACGLNFYDIYIRQGLSPDIQPPCILGLECSGVVTTVGDNVTTVKTGDRVAVHCPEGGACAEQVTVDEESVIAIPKDMSYEVAAAFTINYLTAYFSLSHIGGLREGGAVLIHSAAGGVGWAATQLAKNVADVTVFGTASPQKHELIRQNGVDFPIHHEENYSSMVFQHRKRGVSVVLDNLSGTDFTISQQLLEPLGKVVLIGARRMVGNEQRSLWNVFKTWWATKNVSPYSMIMNNYGVAGFNLKELRIKDPQVFRRGWEEILQKISAESVCPRIDSEWPLEDVVRALQQISERKNIGKVIVKL